MITTLLEISIYFTLVSYAISAICYFINKFKSYAKYIAIIGLIFNGLALVTEIILTKRAPFATGFEFMLCFTFITLIMLIILQKNTGVKQASGAVMIILTLLMLSLVTLMSNQIGSLSNNLMPALNSYWLTYHVITVIIAYSAFALATGIAVIGLKKKEVNVDNTIYKVVGIGFIMLSISIVLGAIWAEQCWGSYWSWDPKETWALVTWLVYAIYLHLHRSKEWKGDAAKMMVIIGFALVLFTYLGVNYLLPGLHSYA